jgi:hypothetical protein
MIKHFIRFLVLLAAAAASARPAAAQSLEGSWTAADARGNLARLVISSDATGRTTAQGYGVCTPTECDWGSVPVSTFGRNVSDAIPSAGIAIFTSQATSTMVTFSLQPDSAVLQVDVFTRFRDGSGRKNYAVHEVFRPTLALGTTRPREAFSTHAIGTNVIRSSASMPPNVTASPVSNQGTGVRTILPDGSVQIAYSDGSKTIYSKGGVTKIAPDGTKTYKPYQYTFISVQGPTPPSVPDNATKSWADGEQAQLLNLIKALVSNDKSSIDNLLARETQMAWYQKIDNRTALIQKLAAP